MKVTSVDAHKVHPVIEHCSIQKLNSHPLEFDDDVQTQTPRYSVTHLNNRHAVQLVASESFPARSH